MPDPAEHPGSPSPSEARTEPVGQAIPPDARLRVRAALAEQQTPQQIGPYRILSLIGEGGMGSVYAAEQLAPIRRMVAIKVIKLGMDTAEVIARFDAERQALAMMDHPNIARVRRRRHGRGPALFRHGARRR